VYGFKLELKRLPETKHYIVVIVPALEQWIIDTSNDLDIPLKKYGFDTVKKLTRVTKHQSVSKNENYKSLINTLKQKKNSPLKDLLGKLNKILGEN
jgi:hypothetical protein